MHEKCSANKGWKGDGLAGLGQRELADQSYVLSWRLMVTFGFALLPENKAAFERVRLLFFWVKLCKRKSWTDSILLRLFQLFPGNLQS